MFSTIPYRTFILLESVIFLLAFHEEKKKKKDLQTYQLTWKLYMFLFDTSLTT